MSQPNYFDAFKDWNALRLDKAHGIMLAQKLLERGAGFACTSVNSPEDRNIYWFSETADQIVNSFITAQAEDRRPDDIKQRVMKWARHQLMGDTICTSGERAVIMAIGFCGERNFTTVWIATYTGMSQPTVVKHLKNMPMIRRGESPHNWWINNDLKEFL